MSRQSTNRGLGTPYLATTILGDGSGSAQKIFPAALSAFEESVESEAVEAEAMVGGILQTVEAGRSRITRTLTLTTQILNTNTRPLVYNQLPKDFTGLSIEVMRNATLDETLTISDPLITVANVESIRVFKSGFGSLTPTALAATAPASASEVQVDTTGNELVFFAGEEGADIAYTVPITAASAKGFGGPGTKTPLGRLSFSCAVFGLDETINEYRYYPALDLVGEPTMTLNGGIPELTLEYRAATPPGWSDPYLVVEADTVIAA